MGTVIGRPDSQLMSFLAGNLTGFYRMPAEYDRHEGTMMIWPHRAGSWAHGAVPARKAFSEIANNIVRHEKLWMLVREQDYREAEKMLSPEVKLVVCDTDDAWARDTGPTYVKDGKGNRRAVDWVFNAWGGSFDGLYASWEKDAKVAAFFAGITGDKVISSHLVLEGGSIHSDGEGTLMVTESCLLSGGRNPHLSREEIERELIHTLGMEKVLWLPRGIFNDETNEHVDNVCAFTAPGEVLLAWCDDENDPQYALSRADYEYLSGERDAKGRKLKIRKLPIPKRPVCVTEEDLAGLSFEEGEDTREAGERLAASYVNFYIANGCVLVPQFDDENDALALSIISECFPEREVIGIAARDILTGGGNIHCITQQVPLNSR